MKVRFFGVRGSVPSPGPATLRYGGNTVCVEVRLRDGTPIILDAGTGLRELGKVLANEHLVRPVTMLLTHLHWDHVLGLPFFAPLYQKETHLQIHPPALPAVREAPGLGIFDGIHFPVRREDLPSRLELMPPIEGMMKVGSGRLHAFQLVHPGGSVGYRLDDSDGHSIAYLTDNEISAARSPEAFMDDLAEFARGVDVLIHDTQYLDTDMPAKRGWGHSLLHDVLTLAKRARTPHVVLFHHDPDRDDDALDAIDQRANEWLRAHCPGTRATVAREGLTLDLS